MDQSPRTPSSYILADRDSEFLQREELRSIRIGLELLKPELIQREQGIRSTIVVFGSARLQEPAAAARALRLAEVEAAQSPTDRMPDANSRSPSIMMWRANSAGWSR
jgi:hypothetical protein